ncbi:MAG: hypothetical protein ACKOTA_10940, partial [Solirubrobacterales bacterium]
MSADPATSPPATSAPSSPAAQAPGDGKPPLMWGFVAIAVPVMGLAVGGAALIGESKNALGSGLIALLTVVAALATPRETPWRAATLIGGATFLMLLLANATIASPVLAGLSMFVVAFLGAMIGGAGQALSVAGIFVSMAYLLPAATGIAKDLSFPKAVELGLVGLGAAFIAIAVITAVRTIKGRTGEEKEAAGEGPPAADEPGVPGSAEAAASAAAQFRAAGRGHTQSVGYARRRAV